MDAAPCARQRGIWRTRQSFDSSENPRPSPCARHARDRRKDSCEVRNESPMSQSEGAMGFRTALDPPKVHLYVTSQGLRTTAMAKSKSSESRSRRQLRSTG